MTPLQRHVNNYLKKNKDEAEDILQYGCQSGMVGHLIYYEDTINFYKKFKKDISELLTEAIFNCGNSPEDVFGDKWDSSDPLAMKEQNQNLLAWFGFEETVRQFTEG